MLIFLALGAALLYGSADFLGGAATRRAALVGVLLTSGLAAVAVLLPAVLLAGGAPRAAGIEWGLVAGAAGGIGLMFFYAGLAAGPMSVVSPVAALMSTVLPVGVAIAQGERPGAAVYAGVLLCLAATVLVSSGARAPGESPRSWQDRGRGVALGLASGTAFGLFFLFMRNAGQSGPLWPALAARSSGLAIFVIAAVVVKAAPIGVRSGWPLFWAALGAGALDAAANICYVLATRAGLFGPAVVLTSLYPAVTVLLARVALRERMHRTQQAGLVLAAVGIALIAA